MGPAVKVTETIGSGKIERIEEYLVNDNGNCSGTVGLTLKHETILSDNGSKKNVSLESDNVSASVFDLTMESVKLSFNDLSYVNGLKPDNVTYLCEIAKLFWSHLFQQ